MTSALVDLAALPPPDVVEALSYEAIRADMLADFVARDSSFSALLESDPAIKVLEVCAYREMNLRARVNDAARAVMLATATGADLDNLGAWYNVARQIVTPADPTAVPPVAEVAEADARYRYRIQLAVEGFSTAGPRGAYEYHALSASPLVKAVGVHSPTPGVVVVTVLSTEGDGTPTEELLDIVRAALGHEDVRPLTDQVIVQAAEILPYQIRATLRIYSGPDAQVVEDAAYASGWDYAMARHKLGDGPTESGIKASLHAAGVQQVVLEDPVDGVPALRHQAAYCTGIILTIEVANG